MCAWKGTRPEEVVLRDRLVLAYLREHGPSTRNKITEELKKTTEDLEITTSKIYLSLDRLRHGVGQPDEKPAVKRCVVEGSSELLWSAAVDKPCE